MGLKGCETCQASCGGSVSRGLNYRIRGLFEIFFNCQIVILLFAGRATRARFSKNNQTCRWFHGGVDHQFSESHPSSWKISLQCKEPKILAAAVLLVGCTARPRGMDVSSEWRLVVGVGMLWYLWSPKPNIYCPVDLRKINSVYAIWVLSIFETYPDPCMQSLKIRACLYAIYSLQFEFLSFECFDKGHGS